jgi:foldase protein PrsA
MNDKLKGLLLGLTLGLTISGSVAYASGTQIEVYFQNLKYMFDGFEKKPAEDQGAGFIYNGTTYVPLRFVSEALGKEVSWDGENQTIWVGKKVDMSAVAAKYQGGEVTLGELTNFLKFNLLLNPANDEYKDNPKYQEYMLNQLISYKVLAARADASVSAALPEAVNQQYEQFKQSLLSNGSGMAFESLLTKAGLTDEQFRGYVELIVTSEKSLTVQVAAESKGIQKASVRHILIGFTDETGKERTKDEVNKKVQEVLAKVKAGGDFAALAKQYSEDPGSKDNGGLYADANPNEWVEPFKKAALELELNKVSDPAVETSYGYHIMRVEGRSVTPFDKLESYEQQQLVSDAYGLFMTEQLPKLIEKISIQK